MKLSSPNDPRNDLYSKMWSQSNKGESKAAEVDKKENQKQGDTLAI